MNILENFLRTWLRNTKLVDKPDDEITAIVARALQTFTESHGVTKYAFPRRAVWSNDGGAIRCPNCGEDLMGGLPEDYDPNHDEEIAYCWHCGQRLILTDPDGSNPQYVEKLDPTEAACLKAQLQAAITDMRDNAHNPCRVCAHYAKNYCDITEKGGSKDCGGFFRWQWRGVKK